VYGSGLDRFDRLLTAQRGDVRQAIAVLRERTAGGGDPWEALKD
jgi:hypothetical protein